MMGRPHLTDATGDMDDAHATRLLLLKWPTPRWRQPEAAKRQPQPQPQPQVRKVRPTFTFLSKVAGPTADQHSACRRLRPRTANNSQGSHNVVRQGDWRALHLGLAVQARRIHQWAHPCYWSVQY